MRSAIAGRDAHSRRPAKPGAGRGPRSAAISKPRTACAERRDAHVRRRPADASAAASSGDRRALLRQQLRASAAGRCPAASGRAAGRRNRRRRCPSASARPRRGAPGRGRASPAPRACPAPRSDGAHQQRDDAALPPAGRRNRCADIASELSRSRRRCRPSAFAPLSASGRGRRAAAPHGACRARWRRCGAQAAGHRRTSDGDSRKAPQQPRTGHAADG